MILGWLLDDSWLTLGWLLTDSWMKIWIMINLELLLQTLDFKKCDQLTNWLTEQNLEMLSYLKISKFKITYNLPEQLATGWLSTVSWHCEPPRVKTTCLSGDTCPLLTQSSWPGPASGTVRHISVWCFLCDPPPQLFFSRLVELRVLIRFLCLGLETAFFTLANQNID